MGLIRALTAVIFGCSVGCASVLAGRAEPGLSLGGSLVTPEAALNVFLRTGSIIDRGLEEAIASSGWSAEDLRFGLTKVYDVDVKAVARFLYSEQGELFLQSQTAGYAPRGAEGQAAFAALRSSIVMDSIDGQISAVGIMRNLPVGFFLTGVKAQKVCKEGLQSPRDSSLLSWYVFLPACVQASQLF
ncbi:MAG: alpha/beta hydrolase [Synechococcus sp.]|nr:alpha/beta hydrolase [Synechococcus sp.]